MRRNCEGRRRASRIAGTILGILFVFRVYHQAVSLSSSSLRSLHQLADGMEDRSRSLIGLQCLVRARVAAIAPP